MSARNETPHKVVQALGKNKCNGSWEDSTENLTMDQIKGIAEEQKDRLTGKSLYARCREVMGTCVAMRVRVEGMEPKVALNAMSEGSLASISARFTRVAGEVNSLVDRRGEKNEGKSANSDSESN